MSNDLEGYSERANGEGEFEGEEEKESEAEREVDKLDEVWDWSDIDGGGRERDGVTGTEDEREMEKGEREGGERGGVGHESKSVHSKGEEEKMRVRWRRRSFTSENDLNRCLVRVPSKKE